MQPILDWKDYSSYAHLAKYSSISLKQWAWEFLRRNKDYQASYDEYAIRAKAMASKHGPDWKNKLDARLYLPPKKSGQSDKKWALNNFDSRRVHLHIESAQPWHLKNMYPPETQWTEVTFKQPWADTRVVFTPDQFDTYLTEYPVEGGGAIRAVKPEFAILAFDLTTDASAKMDNIRKWLVKERKDRKKRNALNTIDGRHDRTHWLDYLRVLDALLNNPRPSNKLIGEVIGFNAVNGEDPAEAGKSLVQQANEVDYRRILKAAWSERAAEKKASHKKA